MCTKVVCKECDTTLWSDRAKHLQLCPECEEVDEEEYESLEDRLERILSS